MQLLLPLLRADFTLCETYQYVPRPNSPARSLRWAAHRILQSHLLSLLSGRNGQALLARCICSPAITFFSTTNGRLCLRSLRQRCSHRRQLNRQKITQFNNTGVHIDRSCPARRSAKAPISGILTCMPSKVVTIRTIQSTKTRKTRIGLRKYPTRPSTARQRRI